MAEVLIIIEGPDNLSEVQKAARERFAALCERIAAEPDGAGRDLLTGLADLVRAACNVLHRSEDGQVDMTDWWPMGPPLATRHVLAAVYLLCQVAEGGEAGPSSLLDLLGTAVTTFRPIE